jgi:hypothetical protein
MLTVWPVEHSYLTMLESSILCSDPSSVAAVVASFTHFLLPFPLNSPLLFLPSPLSPSLQPVSGSSPLSGSPTLFSLIEYSPKEGTKSPGIRRQGPHSHLEERGWLYRLYVHTQLNLTTEKRFQCVKSCSPHRRAM